MVESEDQIPSKYVIGEPWEEPVKGGSKDEDQKVLQVVDEDAYEQVLPGGMQGDISPYAATMKMKDLEVELEQVTI